MLKLSFSPQVLHKSTPNQTVDRETLTWTQAVKREKTEGGVEDWDEDELSYEKYLIKYKNLIPFASSPEGASRGASRWWNVKEVDEDAMNT